MQILYKSYEDFYVFASEKLNIENINLDSI